MGSSCVGGGARADLRFSPLPAFPVAPHPHGGGVVQRGRFRDFFPFLAFYFAFQFNKDIERTGASFVLCVSVYVCVKQFHGHLSCTVNFALLHFKWWA